jgi:mono/diheme cytochrome c family protein
VRTTTAPDPLASLDPAELSAARARGQTIWNTNPCASCHVPDQAPAEAYRPLAALRAKYTIDSLAALLRTPPLPMPAFPLSDDQRRDLAVYLLATYP